MKADTRNFVFDAIGGTITLVWAVSVITTIIDRSYRPPPGLNGIMSLVVGAYSGAKAFDKTKGGGPPPTPPTP